MNMAKLGTVTGCGESTHEEACERAKDADAIFASKVYIDAGDENGCYGEKSCGSISH